MPVSIMDLVFPVMNNILARTKTHREQKFSFSFIYTRKIISLKFITFFFFFLADIIPLILGALLM